MTSLPRPKLFKSKTEENKSATSLFGTRTSSGLASPLSPRSPTMHGEPSSPSSPSLLQQSFTGNPSTTAVNIPEYITLDAIKRARIMDMFPDYWTSDSSSGGDDSNGYGAANNGSSRKPLLIKELQWVIVGKQEDSTRGSLSNLSGVSQPVAATTSGKLKRPTLFSRVMTSNNDSQVGSLNSLKSGSRESLSTVDSPSAEGRPKKRVLFSNAVIDEYQNTLLHLAVANNDEQLVSCLLLKGANPSLANNAGYTALHMVKLLKCTDKIQTMMARHACDNGFKFLPYSHFNVSAPIFETISNENPANLQMIAAATRDLRFPKKYLPSFNSDFYNAAYSNNLKNIPQTVIDNGKLNDRDLYGCTALMKACFQNHKLIVKRLLEKGVDFRLTDQHGYTALVWACLGGSMESFILVYDVISQRRDSSNNTNSSKAFTQTGYNTLAKIYKSSHNNKLSLDCLMASVLGGNIALVKMIIDILQQGDSDAVSSEILAQDAFSLALIEARLDIILLLFRSGLCNVEKWFSTLDPNSWLYRTLLQCEFSVIDLEYDLSKLKVNPLPNGLSAINTSLSLLKKLLPDQISEFDELKQPFWEPVLSSWGSRLASNEILFAHADLLRTPSLATLDRILGKLFDSKGALAHRSLLVQQFQSAGTLLNQQSMTICRTIIELKAAVESNIKAQYVLITTKSLNTTEDLVKSIETSLFVTTSIMHASVHFRKIRELCRKIRNEDARNLLQSTRLAVGAWPPPEAAENMFRSAIKLIEACSKLISLANSTGRWPLGQIDLEQFYYKNTTQNDSAVQSNDSISKRTTATPSPISYADYQKQYEAKLLTQISHLNTPSAESARNSVIPSEHRSKEQINLQKNHVIVPELHVEDKRFFENIDNHVKLFVQSVQALKQASAANQKESYASIAAGIYARIDSLIQDVTQYYLFKTLEDTFTLGPSEYQTGQQATLKETDDCYLTYWKRIAKFRELLLRSADTIILKSKLAAGVWPPPDSVQDMIKSTIPCVVGLKQLGDYLKKVCHVVRLTDNAERTKMEIFMKEWENSARVRQVFDELERMKRKQSNVNAFEDIDVNQNSNDLAAYEDILEDRRSSEKDSGLILEVKEDKVIVKAGRLAKLIEKLTDYLFVEPEFRNCFLLTHQSFTSSLEFLDLLIKRYDIIPPYGLDKRSFEIYLNKKILPIRLRVFNIFKLWISKFPQDFIHNAELGEQLLERLSEFIQCRLVPDFGESSNQQLLSILDNMMNHLNERRSEKEWWQNEKSQVLMKPSGNPPKPILSKCPVEDLSVKLSNLIKNNMSLLGLWDFVDPVEFARQITLIDNELYRDIKPSEFLNQNWEKQSTRLQKSPNICKMIQNTNDLTNWVTLSVISISDEKLRTSVIKFMVQTAQGCFELNNFNAVTAFVAGLGMGPCRRMANTWEDFEDRHPRSREILDDLIEMVSAKGQYSKYRSALKSKTAPIVPFLGVSLTDLSFVELGNLDYIPELNYINFEKRRKVASIINDIQQYQISSYNLLAVEPLQAFIRNIASKYGPWLDEKQMYQKSLETEPRTAEDDSN